MSKTLRKILNRGNDFFDDPFIEIVDDSAAKRRGRYTGVKTTAYIKRHSGIYDCRNKHQINDVFSCSLGTQVRRRTGFGARVKFNHLNKSLKTSLRQQFKKEIVKELQSNQLKPNNNENFKRIITKYCQEVNRKK